MFIIIAMNKVAKIILGGLRFKIFSMSPYDFLYTGLSLHCLKLSF